VGLAHSAPDNRERPWGFLAENEAVPLDLVPGHSTQKAGLATVRESVSKQIRKDHQNYDSRTGDAEANEMNGDCCHEAHA
jgi:hypothetical protein